MKWNGLKCGMVTGGLTIFFIIFGFILFPVILKSQLKKEMALSKKTDVREMWERMPFPMDYKIYMFNYTNPQEIQNGGIPIVKEIGPFHISIIKQKIVLEDNEEDDTVSYQRIDKYYFRADLSGPGLTGEEVLTLPHIFIMGLGLAVSRTQPKMLSVAGKALNGIFNKPSDIFLRAKVLDILLRGVMINCSQTEFAPKAVCAHMKKEGGKRLQFEQNDQIRFSLFGPQNSTLDSKVITVKRGIKNVMDVGRIMAIDGEPQQKTWRDSCNDFIGTDGTVFPPFMKPTNRVLSFYIDLCRPFRLWFEKKTKYRGITTYKYVGNLGDLINDPDVQCYCEAPDKCPPHGLMDMFSCMEVALYASMPHFVDSDPKLLEQVKGLTPDVEQHRIIAHFEPITGTPMVVRQRMQFNMELMKSEKIPLFKNLTGIIAPLFWVDEGYDLNKTFVNMMKRQLFTPKRVVNVGSLVFIILGIISTAISIGFHYRERIMDIVTSKTNVKKVVPVKEEQKKDISVIGPSQEPTKIDM